MWRAALGYAALTLLLAFPLSVHPATRVMADAPDTNLYVWTLAWDAHAFVHQPLAIFDANIFAPEPRTLAYSENLIGSALVAAPVIWLTGNAVLAMNLVLLLACVLCALGARWLALRVGLSPPAAMLAGLVFAFAPPRFLRLDQVHLATIQWIPFALGFLHRYLDGGRARDLRWAAAFFTLQVLTSGHGAVFLTIAGALLIGYRVALGEPVAAVRRVRDLGVVGILVLVPAALVMIPYVIVQRSIGLKRTLGDWAVPASSFLASPTHLHAYLLSLAPAARINETAGAYLFPGYVALLLAACAWIARDRADGARRGAGWRRAAAMLDVAAVAAAATAVWTTVAGPLRLRAGEVTLLSVRGPLRPWLAAAIFVALRAAIRGHAPFVWRSPGEGVRRAWDALRAGRRDAVTFYSLLAVVCVLLAAGPPFGIWPWVYWLPGFNFVRAPSRFMMLALVAIAVLAAAGFDRVTSRLTPRARAVAALAVGLLLVAEYAAIPLGTEPFGVEIPAIDRWLAERPAGSEHVVVAEVPSLDPEEVGPAERRQTTYMIHATAHWRPTVHGYSGFVTPRALTLYRRLATFPSDDSLVALADAGVTELVVHADGYAPDRWREVERRIDERADVLRLEHVEGNGRVYAVGASPSGSGRTR